MHGIELFRLDGRVGIVTGDSKGLGESMAAGLASAGADLVLTSRHVNEVEAAARKIAAEFGRKVIGIAADVTNTEDVDRLITRTLAA